MYTVSYIDPTLECVEHCFDTLGSAMDWAKTTAKFVTITGNGMEIVGKFGVDSIQNGLCPDGVEYSWRKRRI
jgi:hypothetical protein